jgi:hypothetical protein
VSISLILQKISICTIDDIQRALLCKLFTDVVFRLVGASAPWLTLGDCEEIRQIYSVIARFAYYRRPGAFLVDTFPQLADSKLFNLISSWRKEGKEMQQKDTDIYRSFWERLKREMKEGTAPHSWGKGFIQSDYQKLGIDELGAIYAAYTVPFPS